MAEIFTLVEGYYAPHEYLTTLKRTTTVLIVSQEQKIVVDPGWSTDFYHLQAALKKLNLTARDINTVVLTHTHFDHFINVGLFDHAALYVHQAELDFVSSGAYVEAWGYQAWYASQLIKGLILECPRLVAFRGDVDLTAEVKIIETAKHTPGSCVVWGRLEAADFLIAGDEPPEILHHLLRRPTHFYPGHGAPYLVNSDAE